MPAAPTAHQTRNGLFRLMTEKPLLDGKWQVSINGTQLVQTAFVERPIPHPHEGFLGQPTQYATFAVPRSLVRDGVNEIEVTRTEGSPAKLIHMDLVLP